jgi:REP element-mobilizing transposase RayT
MPRKARIDAAGAIQHIIIRGIERKKIFRSDADRHSFLERFGTVISETQTACFAWALIPNHVHLLVRTGLAPIATVMRRLLTGYAVSFNRKYRRHGQLFQNRYKSILCQEDMYLKELVRYIHLNPLRAKLVSDMKALDKYPWCGHSATMGKIRRNWQSSEYVLKIFGTKVSDARRNYRAFVQKGIAAGRRPELAGGGLIRSLGGWQQERRYAIEVKGYDFEKVVARVAAVLNIEYRVVLSRSKDPQTVKARRLLCYWANQELGMTTIEIAHSLKISQSTVSRASRWGEKIASENEFHL